MYRRTVVPLNKGKYNKAKKGLVDIVLGEDMLYASFNGGYYVCKTCDSALSRGHIPLQSLANNLKLSSVPPELTCLNKLETRLLCLRIAFMKLVALPSGKQRCIHGPAVNIPVKVETVTTTLPRLPNQSSLIALKFKRKLCYKGHYMYDFVTPEKILEALKWLRKQHPQYANVKIIDNWCVESQNQDFDMHAGFMNACVLEEEPTVAGTHRADNSFQGSVPPLIPSSSTSCIDNTYREEPEYHTLLSSSATSCSRVNSDGFVVLYY